MLTAHTKETDTFTYSIGMNPITNNSNLLKVIHHQPYNKSEYTQITLKIQKQCPITLSLPH